MMPTLSEPIGQVRGTMDPLDGAAQADDDNLSIPTLDDGSWGNAQLRWRPPRRQNSAEGLYRDSHKGVFADAENMKEQIRKQIQKEDYSVEMYYYKTGVFQFIAKHPWFELVTLIVIALNAVWIGVDADYNHAEVLTKAPPIFQIIEHFFSAYFTLEWVCRFMAFQRKRNCMRDSWFVFDTVLVSAMVLENWIMSLLIVLTGVGTGSSMGNASVLRIARLLRLMRMARMARLLRAMPELMILIKGMFAAVRSVFFTLFLLLVILYVFGIAFRQLSSHTDVGEEYFGSVLISMHSLLVHGTFLDSLAFFVELLQSNGVHLLILFYLFVLISSLTVTNMLIGVLCEVVSAVARTEREAITVSYVKEKLNHVMHHTTLDANGDGCISKDEFMTLLTDKTAEATLQEVGVDVVGLVDFADFIFQDEVAQDDGYSDVYKTLTFPDFMEVILQFRGTNQATVRDIVDLRRHFMTRIGSLEERLSRRTSYCEVSSSEVLHRGASAAEEPDGAGHGTGTCYAGSPTAPAGFNNNVHSLPLHSSSGGVSNQVASCASKPESTGTQHGPSASQEALHAHVSSFPALWDKVSRHVLDTHERQFHALRAENARLQAELSKFR